MKDLEFHKWKEAYVKSCLPNKPDIDEMVRKAFEAGFLEGCITQAFNGRMEVIHQY